MKPSSVSQMRGSTVIYSTVAIVVWSITDNSTRLALWTKIFHNVPGKYDWEALLSSLFNINEILWVKSYIADQVFRTSRYDCKSL